MAKKEVSSKKELGVEENKKSLAKNKKATAKKSTKQPKKSRT